MNNRLKKLTEAQVEESVRMYRSGLSLGAIGAYFGVSRQSMWDLLRRRMKLRPQLRFGSKNHFHRGGVRSDGLAHNLVETACSSGVLQRPSACEKCGSAAGKMKDGRTNIHAHHDDYNKPLDVRWLCQKCHHDWHKHNKVVRLKTTKKKG